MPLPKAYDPEYGYMYQYLYLAAGQKEYDHLDYAVDKADKKHLDTEYALAYRGQSGTIKVIKLPRKYWPKKGADNGESKREEPTEAESGADPRLEAN